MKKLTDKRDLFPFVIVSGNIEGLQAKHRKGGYPIYLMLVAALVFSVAALPFIEVEVSGQSRGILRPLAERSPVTTAVGGRLLEIYIKENRQVCPGDTLAVISSDELTPEITALERELSEHRYLVKDVSQLANGETSPILQSALYQRDHQSYQQRLEEARLKTAHAKRHFERQQTLMKTRTIARMEFEQAQFEFDLAVGQERSIQDQQLRLWTQEKERLQREFREMSSRLTTLHRRADNHVVTAPIEGSLTKVTGLQTGSFASPGQQLAVISPDGLLHAEVYVSPSDIGLVRKNMSVTLQLDAFNHNQWGLATGRVTEIAQDVSEANNQPVFRVKCEVFERHLCLKNGYVGRLKKGMTLTAHFTLAERSLYQLLHDKVDDWLNPNAG